MGKVKDINEAREELKTKENSMLGEEVDSVEYVKQLIESNDHLKMAVRILSGLDIEASGYNEVNLFNDYKEKCLKENITFLSLDPVEDITSEFYYQFFQLGYRTFGGRFFTSLISQNPEHMIKGAWALVVALEVLSQGCMSHHFKALAYESIELTEEQKTTVKTKYDELMNNPTKEFEEMTAMLEEELDNKNEKKD